MIKKIFKRIFWIFIHSIDKIASLFYLSNQKYSLIVIRTDAIGDYILFRNFLKPLYKKYGKLTLVGNIAYQELVFELDREYIQEFIPIDRKKFIRNIFYRFKMIKKLRENSYTLLINPIYSRDRVSEDIAKIIDAKEKITSIGDSSNLPQSLKEKYDKNYTTLLPTKNEPIFEFYRNLDFFRQFISKKLEITLHIDPNQLQKKLCDFNLSLPYSILFIGASEDFRKWNTEYFAEIGLFLIKQFQDNIVICGGNDDYMNGEYIKKVLNKISKNVINLCGQTSLIDLTTIIQNTHFLITNETSSAHIAMAIKHSKTFVISNGNHLYRFTPYPKEMNVDYHVVFHPLVQQNINSYQNIADLIEPTSRLDINEISPKTVISAIQKLKI